MKNLLLAALLSAVLLLDTDVGDDDLDENESGDTDEEDRPSPLSFLDLREAAATMARYFGGDEAADFFVDAQRPSDLAEPGGEQALGFLRDKGQLALADDLEKLRTAELEAKRVRDEEAVKSSRESVKAQLRSELEREAREVAEREEAERLRLELLDEIRSEQQQTRDAPVPFEDEQLAVIGEALEIVESDAPVEEQVAAADRGIAAAAALEVGTEESPVDFDPDEFLEQFNATQSEKE